MPASDYFNNYILKINLKSEVFRYHRMLKPAFLYTIIETKITLLHIHIHLKSNL